MNVAVLSSKPREAQAPVRQTSQEAVRSMQQPEWPTMDGLSPEGQGLDGHPLCYGPISKGHRTTILPTKDFLETRAHR